jgi:phosphodiesterase/alkaline phosphatase D-like protein
LGGGSITDYDVEYSTDPAFAAGSGTFFEGGTTTTNLVDVTGLTGGVTYYFRARVANAAGNGPWSNIVGGIVAPSTAPGVPTNVTAARVASGVVRVSFTAPGSAGDSAVIDYDVEYSTDPVFLAGSGTFFEGGTTAASYVDVTGLVNGRVYYFRVRAQNAAGVGAWSSVSAGAAPFTTPSAPAAPAVSNLPGNVVRVTAVAPTTGGSAITDYDVQFSTSSYFGSATFFEGTASDAGFVDVTGLMNGRTYYFWVCAQNAAGCGDWSSSSVSIVAMDIPSAAPTSLSGLGVALGTVRVSWTVPTALGGGSITDYDVEYSTDPAFAAGSGTFFEGGTTTTNYVDVTGLTLGVVYYFRARVANAAGNGPWSNVTIGAHA